MKINEVDLNTLVTELEQDFDDIRLDYSGRGMYGQKCLAIVVEEAGDLWAVARILHRERAWAEKQSDTSEEYLDLLETMIDRAPSMDTLGLGVVFYWPNIQVGE